MGAFLDKPKTEKRTAFGEGNGIRYGVSAMQGWRMEMEDAHVCDMKLPFAEDSCFFGVFDGHAGPKAAQFCSTHLIDTIAACYKKEKDAVDRIGSAIRKGFIELDKDMKNREPWSNSEDRSGTTAVAALITPELIYLGNCGDSRAILCQEEKLGLATADHKPYNEDERLRIEKAGGTVMMQRVNGSLAVSRALGDFDYKRRSSLPDISQLVSPEPDITPIKRNLAKDHFLLLACDGIFDVMTNEDVVSYVSRQLTLKSDLTVICSSLIDKCLNKNSRDNMSVILVVFPAAPSVSESAIMEEMCLQKRGIEFTEEKIHDLVKEALDPIDLEEHQVLGQIQSKMPDELKEFDVYTCREQFVDLLLKLRKEKFKDGDFSGYSDPSDAPHDLAPLVDMMLSREQEGLDELPSANMEPIISQPLQASAAMADSDTTIEGTTNKTIM